MNRPEKLIYFEVVQNAENGYAYGGFESLHEAIAHLPEDNSAHIEMTTEVHEAVDLNNPCRTCKYWENMTILRCRECKSPFWKNHEPRDLFKENKEEYNCHRVKIKDKDGKVMGDIEKGKEIPTERAIAEVYRWIRVVEGESYEYENLTPKVLDRVIRALSAEKTDRDLITEIDKLPRFKIGNSNSPTVKYCIDEVLLYDLLEHYKEKEDK